MGKMSKHSKTRSYLWLAIKSVVAGSVVVSRTFAAPVPAAPDHTVMVDHWRAVGQQTNGQPSALPKLDESLVDMIATTDLQNGLSDVVLATYEMVDPLQLRALDAHWAAVLTAAGNAALVAEFLNVRSGLNIAGKKITQEVDDVLWLESRMSKKGCDACNSGRGNESETDPNNDCDPGNSGGKNQGGD